MSDTSTTPDLREAVAEHYAAAARTHLNLTDASAESCCGGTGCCGGSAKTATISAVDPITRDLYDPETPFDAALAASLGCGNPTALAELGAGEVVLDLGSGGGIDVLLSARRVGPTGHAYGLDMTDEMLDLARANAASAGAANVTFLKGTIEDIPLPDASVDVIISNCVINLSGDKDRVLREAFRVLRPGGRFAVSDIVALRDLPADLRRSMELWAGCLAGALVDTEFVRLLEDAGFTQTGVEVTRRYTAEDAADALAQAGLDPTQADAVDGALASAFVRAVKPGALADRPAGS